MLLANAASGPFVVVPNNPSSEAVALTLLRINPRENTSRHADGREGEAARAEIASLLLLSVVSKAYSNTVYQSQKVIAE